MRLIVCCLAVLAALPAAARAQGPSLVPGAPQLSGPAAPGATVSLTQEVRNVGDEDTAAAQGTLAGPTVTDGGPEDYPAIAAGDAETNASPFAFTVPAGAACGDPLDMTLTVGSTPLPLRFVTGAAGPLAATSTSVTPLADGAVTTSSLTVGDVGIVRDVNVRLDRVRHEFAADLELALVAPDGTVVVLADRRGGNGQDYDRTLFDDQALAPAADADAPFNAHLRPDQPLGALNGKAAKGTWKLRVTDHSTGDTGELQGWSLELIATECGRPSDPGPSDPGPTDPGPTDPGPTDPGPTDPGTPPAPGGGGGGGATNTGVLTTLVPPTLKLTAPRSARTFARRGVIARVACGSVSCRFRVKLMLDKRTAKRRRLRRTPVITSVRELPAGEYTDIRLRPRQRARLRRVGKGLRVTVQVTFERSPTLARTFRLSRR